MRDETMPETKIKIIKAKFFIEKKTTTTTTNFQFIYIKKPEQQMKWRILSEREVTNNRLAIYQLKRQSQKNK